MKKLTLIILLFWTITIYGQSNYKLNVVAGIGDYNYKYTYPTEIIFKDLKPEISASYSIDVQLELKLTESISFTSGLGYSRIALRPNMALNAWYGFVFPIEGSDEFIYMNAPYLGENNFDILRIPFLFKKYISQNDKASVYILGGMDVGFKFNESEIYMDNYFSNEIENGAEHVTYSDKEFKLFNSATNIGFGLNYRLANKISLLVESKLALLEYRAENEKFKKNGEILWKETLVPISQISINLGIQKSF